MHFIGNLSIKDIEEKLNITIPENTRFIMQYTKQNECYYGIDKGKWHCFEFPFCICCGGFEIAREIANGIKPLQDQISCDLHIAIIGEDND